MSTLYSLIEKQFLCLQFAVSYWHGIGTDLVRSSTIFLLSPHVRMCVLAACCVAASDELLYSHFYTVQYKVYLVSISNIYTVTYSMSCVTTGKYCSTSVGLLAPKELKM